MFAVINIVYIYLMVALEVYSWLFFAYILLSWLPFNESQPFFGFLIRFLRALCEPVYEFIMRFLPPLRIGILDFSPMYVFLIIALLRIILSRVFILFLG
ncbi:YggT family protein [Thermospira aquatica]|uniref:YggT family protein n=1 Tax=Thermospira aquatica TaxID=2828656 RepID=A0AAX3BAU6_9SPIR|nr:YggT family protein [Thermospira aquatica]URA09114.1 YggT family protein [Thermospira aquatica]